MKNTRRLPIVVLVPGLLLVLGLLGNSCSQPNNNDAAMYAAYMAALASNTAASVSSVAATVTAVSVVTVVTTTPAVSSSITTINH